MLRALDLAQIGKGRVSPNPMVGAVLVHQGRIIGEGFHAAYGEVHAEVAAIDSVAKCDQHLIPDATLFVTLEPCAHQGKQPPCAQRIVQEGIKTVIVATLDPYTKVQGKGIQILRDAGIEVTLGILENKARWMARRFLTTQTLDRPYIILKWAESAESFFAPLAEERKQLSNHFSMELVQQWRAEEAAILVGYKTALIDNPKLTNRSGKGLQPLRVVLDRRMSLPNSHHLLQDEHPTWILNSELENEMGTKHFRKMDFDKSLLPSLLHDLKMAGKNSLIVEGGAQLLQAFIDVNLWDEARVFRTSISLEKGLESPTLSSAQLLFQTEIDTDCLNIFQNRNSAFPYSDGMKL